jgi:hypothetical protein
MTTPPLAVAYRNLIERHAAAGVPEGAARCGVIGLAGQFRAMARQAGAAVRSFTVRHQFTAGDLVCSVIDWEMAPVAGTMTAAEVLYIRDGRIVRGELIYDAEELRRAMAAQAPANAG